MRDPNRYAAILRLREQAEDRQAQALSAVRHELHRAARQRTALERTRQTALEQAGTSLQGHFDAADLRSYYQYERHLAHLRDEKDAEIRALTQREAEQMSLLEQVTKERRIAEKLHEHRRHRYRAYLRHEEQKILDETATMYAARAGRALASETDRGAKT